MLAQRPATLTHLQPPHHVFSHCVLVGLEHTPLTERQSQLALQLWQLTEHLL